MTEQHWDRVQELLDEAVACPGAEREELLAKACGDDAQLRAEVESLLDHEGRVDDGFLRPPEVPEGGRRSLLEDAPELAAGARVGRYEIKRVIASGGMGTVYEAVQDDPSRVVALKVMRRNVASRSALRRFQLESQVLGHLRHPNVAQVFEAGMADLDVAQRATAVSAEPPAVSVEPPAERGWATGVPYFAMEFVPEARSITRYPEEKQLSLRKRLAMFAKVCDAVHHGHQKGIIHRDLKPGNILVDAAGEPKVIDFGVARATDADIAVTLQTDAGQIIGTLQYMSPEQCDAGATDVDIRSDVYSLGVVLYELLCGRTPYDVSDTTIVQAARVICEHKPPRPASIDRRLRGDVETIVLKALEKSRERRYQSAAGLAHDIDRYLKHEPISARRPTAWLRMTHWIARRPLGATAAACLSLATMAVCFTVISMWWVNFIPTTILLLKLPRQVHLQTGYAAQLLARSGKPLWRWPEGLQAADENVIAVAEMAERPAAWGGGHVAVLGFMQHRDPELSGALAVFDVNGDLERPLWQRRITNEEVLPELRTNRGYIGADFGVRIGIVADVFPDLPGPEIVAVFGHARNSQRVLRIYDLRGDLLYQVWHDGSIGSIRWVPDKGLLVFAGDYQRPFWNPDGSLKAARSRLLVVIALRPKAGLIVDDWLNDGLPGADKSPISPVWFKVLEPADAALQVDSLFIREPQTGRYSASHTFVKAEVDAVALRPSFNVSWVLDKSGNVLPGTHDADDNYKRNLNLPPDDPDKLPLPDWRVFKLVPFDPSRHVPQETDTP